MNITEDNNQVPVGSSQEDPNGQKVIRNFITSEPEIRVVDINQQSDDFIVLASDGLFDRFSSQECVKIVRQQMADMDEMEQDTQKIAEQLVAQAKNKRMMTDNITVILVALKGDVASN